MIGPARKPYLTDLTDDQWMVLEPLIPRSKPGGRPREVDLREVINTILYLNRTGCQWDLLPHDLLPKSTVYEYFAQWRDDDVPLMIPGCDDEPSSPLEPQPVRARHPSRR